MPCLHERDGDCHLDESLGEWPLDRKLQCTLGRHVAGNVIWYLGKYGTTVRQIAEMVLERGESSYDLAPESVRRHPIRDDLLGFGNDAANGLPQLLQRSPFGLIELRQILVNLLLRHELNSERWRPVGVGGRVRK